MSEPYKGLNAALARTGGPSAEDVEALRALLAALRYGSHTFTTHEMAERIAASDWLADHTAAAEARGAERGVRGVRFRVEVACGGYANLMDEDVPGDVSDLAAYQQGAHDAAEAIRAVLIEGGA
jgi:hypothetical protein